MGKHTVTKARVLVVERSATLRHTLGQVLRNGHFGVAAIASPIQAAKRLQAEGLSFSAVVLGWPQFRNDAATLAETLCLDELSHLGVIVLSDDPDLPDKNLLRRQRCSSLTWPEHRRICEVLRAFADDEPSADQEPEDTTDQPVSILLVDDSRTVRKHYSQLLRENRYQVVTAGNVNEGFRAALAGRFDIAVIDYFMPDANGDELCRRLREHPATCHITTSVLTGAYRDPIIRDSLAAGAVECMFKNESEALFLARVAAMARWVMHRRGVEKDRRHLKSILDSVADAVYGVDTQGRLTYMNPAARTMLEIGDQDIVGIQPFELFHHSAEDGQRLIAETCFLTQAYASDETMSDWRTVFWTRSGKAIPVEGSILPSYSEGRRQGSVVAFRDVAEQKLLEDELRWQAQHDPLTGLENRHSFDQSLEQECRTLRRSGRSSALVFIDLDRFKQINDRAGHEAGDSLLIEVGKRLAARLRATDTLTRLGGDEFALILRNIDPGQVLAVADTFRKVLADLTFSHAGKSFDVNGSLGVTILDANTSSASVALAQADQAAKLAKSQGRNQTHLYQPCEENDSSIPHDIGWSARIKRALAEQLLVLEFQPELSSASNTTKPPPEATYEALLRISSDNGPAILPGAFLPAAERFNLMLQLDRWVCKQCINLLAASPDSRFNISVNLSLDALNDARLPDDVQAWLEEESVASSRLHFEINQTALNTDYDTCIAFMARVRKFGCSVALDDFGSGVTSLMQLRNIPVDRVKIDGRIVQEIATEPVNLAIVKALCSVAHACGQLATAKCVESAEALSAVQNCGVDLVQGFHICHPQAAITESQADLLQPKVPVAPSIR